MPETPAPRRPQADKAAPAKPARPAATSRTRIPLQDRNPITAPAHSWFTSPARSHASKYSGQGRELPLHIVLLILEHLDTAADLARITRTSRLLYYMTLPRLYQHVTLRSYSEMRYVDGSPEGFGGGSPFAAGLNTLVSRNFTQYVESFRVVGDWREHDVDDYAKGRVPDNSMMLQIAMRAALDKMKALKSFAWELNTKPLSTIYQSLINLPPITSFTLRCPTKRIPRPTTLIPPLPGLVTLIIYDIDPLCYPDDFSLLLATSKKLENLMFHWNPRMRESGEESVNLMNYFARSIAMNHIIPAKRLAFYNMYARNTGEGFERAADNSHLEEITVINSMGSSQDPIHVFLDNTWRVANHQPVPYNLKMMKIDNVDKEHIRMLSRFSGMERLYVISDRRGSKPCSTAATPTTPSNMNTGTNANSTPTMNGVSTATTPTITEPQCKNLAGEHLAVIQSNHRGIKHLLLPDYWQLSDETLFRLCQSCPDLEQLGFSCAVPHLDSLRQIIALVPKLFAIRVLVRPNSELAEKIEAMEIEMHQFAVATESWRPEYKNLRYFGLGDKLIFKLGDVVFPPKGKGPPPGTENTLRGKSMGPVRRITRIEREDVNHVEIWGKDTKTFVPSFPFV